MAGFLLSRRWRFYESCRGGISKADGGRRIWVPQLLWNSRSAGDAPGSGLFVLLGVYGKIIWMILVFHHIRRGAYGIHLQHAGRRGKIKKKKGHAVHSAPVLFTDVYQMRRCCIPRAYGGNTDPADESPMKIGFPPVLDQRFTIRVLRPMAAIAMVNEKATSSAERGR